MPRQSRQRVTRLKFVLVGSVSFFLSNFLFVFFWYLADGARPYWQIALTVTIIASVISFFLQQIFTFGWTEFSAIKLLSFTALQLFWLPLAIILVPSISNFLMAPIIILQVMFTGLIVIGNYLILNHKSRINPSL